MKNSNNLRLLLFGMAVCAVWFVGCAEHADSPIPGPNHGGQGSDIFDFATKANVPLRVDYAFPGNKALFEVYAENPVVVENGAVHKKEGIGALLRAYTDGDCTYSGLIDLPTALGKVYLYSESYGVPACVEVAVTADGIAFDRKEYLAELRKGSGSAAAARPVSGTRAGNPYNIAFLGEWDNWGLPYYLEGERHGDNFMFYPADVPAGLMHRIQNVLLPGQDNTQYARPTAVVNINVTKDARLDLVFLAEMASWRNAIGYYYYDTQNPPRTQAEFDALPKYIAFPNCSVCDPFGAGTGDVIAGSQGFYVAPLDAGAHLKMRYFRNGQATEVFPAGTTVGWFLLPDGFKVSSEGKSSLDISGTGHPIHYSNNEFNAKGASYMVSLYDKVSGKTVLGFEDSADGDYKDVLFYVEADPQEAIYDPERPTTDPEENYPDVVGDPIEGTLAFEDLWPSQGDYDMNDVVIAYSTTFTTDKDNRLVGIKDVFTPLNNGGQLPTAFGYQLDLPAAAVKRVRIENGSSTAQSAGNLEKDQDKPVVMLFDDMREALARGPVTVTIELDGSVSASEVTRKSLCNPFICVSDKGFVSGAVRKEIHLTNYAPTSLADPYPFGRNDDKSTVDKEGNPIGPYYYVTSDSHPFAIDLPVTNYRIPDEMRTIDEFYPDFPKWVASKGEKYREWYLKPAR